MFILKVKTSKIETKEFCACSQEEIDCKVIRLTIWSKGQWQLVLESEWSPNRDTVIPYGITVKTRFGTKPHPVKNPKLKKAKVEKASTKKIEDYFEQFN